jgi:ABC-2 type transport system ATP-binding protein
MNGPTISFTGVTKRYGRVVALDQVSFAIQPGEMVALLGPNGAGKSTTVDVLLGLRQPDSGTAKVLGQAPQRATRSGRVGAMLQSGSLPDRALVGEVVELARKLYRSLHGLTGLLELGRPD